jgi:arginase family enzyme
MIYIVRTGAGKWIGKGLEQALQYLENKGQLDLTKTRHIDIPTVNEDPGFDDGIGIDKDILFENDLKYSDRPLILTGSNYLHHLTYLYSRKINSGEFSILNIDRHPDGIEYWTGKDSTYANKIDCARFFCQTLQDNPNLKNIRYSSGLGIYGASKEHKSVEVIRSSESENDQEKYMGALSASLARQVYITIDLDCMPRRFVETDFHKQSEMSLEFLSDIIKRVSAEREIIGADICGLSFRGVSESSLLTYSAVFNQLKRAMKLKEAEVAVAGGQA